MGSATRHSAPLAMCRVGRHRLLAGALWLAWCLVAALTATVLLRMPWSWGGLLMGAILALSAWHVRSYIQRLPEGELQWASPSWQWRAGRAAGAGTAAESGSVEPVWDVQQALLLRFHPQGQSSARWLWIERPLEMPSAAWLSFRRAVYSSPASHDGLAQGIVEQ